MTRFTASVLLFSMILASSILPGQQPNLHPYLAERLQGAAPTEQLPVYFVMADRLGYEHWFPRVNQLPMEERRTVVMGELRKHAASTQAVLLEFLRRHEQQGRVTGIRSNWLGNFVYCRANAPVVYEAAHIPGVQRAWFDATWPLELVEDGVVHEAPGAARDPVGGRTTTGLAPPGDGPIDTRADMVWALGFQGQGVVVMNADSGVNLDNMDLANRHWVNPGEIPGNGIDDDNNGYVDDINGWNFFDNNNVIHPGVNNHGTMTAACLAADGTCSGLITGQAPEVKVITASIGGCCPQAGPVNPAGEVAQWDAIQYAIQMGAHVQTSSHSYKNGFVPPPNYAMHRDVGENSLAAGLIRTNSSSNNGTECNTSTLVQMPFNISCPANQPCPYRDPSQTLWSRKGGVIGVGAHQVSTTTLVNYSPCGPFAWYLADLLLLNPSYPVGNWDSVNDNDFPWLGGASQGLIKPDITGPTGTQTGHGGIPCGIATSTGTSTATPRTAGCIVLWKCANMSLKPEDMAMIVHQSARETGNVIGKENTWGAGQVDALDGLHLALCVHRVNGEPAWDVEHVVGSDLVLEVDTVPNQTVLIVVGTSRIANVTHSGVTGIGGPTSILYSGTSGPTGEVALTIPIPPSLYGQVVYTQCFTDDQSGVTGSLLSSNVVETRFVLPPFSLDISTSGGGTGDLHLGLEGIPPGTVEGMCIFSLETSAPIGSGSLFGITPTFLSVLSVTAPALVGDPLHWIWPVTAPDFPAAPLDFPPGSLTFSPGTQLDAVAIALGPGFSPVTQTPVVRLTL